MLHTFNILYFDFQSAAACYASSYRGALYSLHSAPTPLEFVSIYISLTKYMNIFINHFNIYTKSCMYTYLCMILFY